MPQELNLKERPPAEGHRSGRDPQTATVNGQDVRFADPVPDGRGILAAAGFVPADAHVLIQLLRHGTRSVGLDETVDLREEGREVFRAFDSDRIFTFTLDGRGYEWGASSIQEDELRVIAGVKDDEILVLEREDAEDLPIASGAEIFLAGRGSERLRTKKHLVTVYLDEEPKTIAAGTYTTEQLIEVLGVPEGYLLNLVNEHGQLETLKPGQHVRVKEGMRFLSGDR